MAEVQVYVSDPFGRDVSWITQEVCEQFAGACLTSRRAADQCAEFLCQGDYDKAAKLRLYLIGNASFIALQQELVSTYGLEHFIKPKSKEEHIRDLEDRMETETNNETYAKLSKELRELRGWVLKPADAAPMQININNVANAMSVVDKSNPRELQRAYQSIMG
jgi:hypothetical protein